MLGIESKCIGRVYDIGHNYIRIGAGIPSSKLFCRILQNHNQIHLCWQ